ncbi:hypothetical protein LRS13_19145 [Svornostia abyssi]|uniref:Glycosyltransferase RgtA/B/C/D-like domain-containing protein n=1 Tax=Svornostia abyssi TaxID=2898438 RepID=A0ABY5PED1_9ACTN|nr:hypothetical protein LRS13_19145 [Parviterribacteraceae bacterium J379]
MSRTTGLRLALLFAAGVVISGVGVRHGIQPNDEGLMLQAARRIADGQVPYRDFWWFYPPGQAYLLAGLQEVFGPSLVPWRVLRVLCDAGVGVLAYLLALRAASPRLALGAWAVAILAMATPSGPHPFPPTLVLCLGALLLVTRHPVWAGALCGAAAAWRLEFGAGLGLAVVLGLALAPGGDGARPRGRELIRFVVAAVGAGVVLYAPVVIAAGLRPSWDLLIHYPLFEFADYQRLPFPLTYDGPLNVDSPGGFVSDTLENLLLFYVPLVLVIGLAASLVALALRWRRLDAVEIATAVFAIVMLQYLLARTDEFHTAPLAVMVAILGAWAISRRADLLRARAAVPIAATCALALAYVAIVGADRRVRALTAPTTAIASPVADGVRAGRAHDDGLNDTLRFLRSRTRPGEPIYVATRRSDLVTAGHPLLYVLADRPNPTAYDIQAPGVVTSAPVQREIVEDLRRANVRYVVRYTDPVTAAPEPNRAGESTGVRILDDELARAYAPVRRYGPFVIYERLRP